MNTPQKNWQPAGFAARISCLALALLERAAIGTLGDDQRILAKALYALARIVTPTPVRQVGVAWTSALYSTLGMSGIDPPMPQFEDRARALRLTDRGLINAAFGETVSPKAMLRLIRAGRALAGEAYDEADVVDRGFGLALLAIAELRFNDREPTTDETRERDRVYATGLTGMVLWTRINEARELFNGDRTIKLMVIAASVQSAPLTAVSA